MNWDQTSGEWFQLKGVVRQQWERLTVDDLEMIGASEEAFVGKIQERYGIAREEAKRQMQDWIEALRRVEARVTPR